MNDAEHRRWLAQAVDLALENVRAGGRPFGAVLVKDGVLIASGVNRMLATNDPSSHAEMEALRQAGPALGGVDLDDLRLPRPRAPAGAYRPDQSQQFVALHNPFLATCTA